MGLYFDTPVHRKMYDTHPECHSTLLKYSARTKHNLRREIFHKARLGFQGKRRVAPPTTSRITRAAATTGSDSGTPYASDRSGRRTARTLPLDELPDTRQAGSGDEDKEAYPSSGGSDNESANQQLRAKSRCNIVLDDERFYQAIRTYFGYMDTASRLGGPEGLDELLRTLWQTWRMEGAINDPSQENADVVDKRQNAMNRRIRICKKGTSVWTSEEKPPPSGSIISGTMFIDLSKKGAWIL